MTLLRDIAQLLKPRIFLQHWFPPPVPRKLRSTAWLDGLRGVASLIVVVHHFCQGFFPSALRGWARTETDYNLIQFYFIRVLIAGSLMVTIFFIISGYVLSQRTLQLARTRQYMKVFEGRSSSAFRHGYGLCSLQRLQYSFTF